MVGLEVAASVVGIVSLGIEIGKNAMKLRDFYKSVKGAPEEIGYLLEEIETFRMIFSNFEALGNDIAGASLIEPSLPMQTCLARCQREAEIVASQVRSLNVEIGTRRKVGSFKAVLKRGSIERLRERLKTAAFLLMFSHGLYSSELQKQSHLSQQNWFAMYSHQLLKVQHIEAAVTQNQLVSSDPPESGIDNMKLDKQYNLSSSEENITFPRHRQRRLAQLKLPKWLRTVGIGIEIYYNPGRYVLNNCNIHVYNTVDWDAPIFRLTETGDLDGIRRLLDEGKATPFDRNPSGLTVLDLAATNHHLEIYDLFINQGARADMLYPGSTLLYTFVGPYPSCLSQNPPFEKLSNLLHRVSHDSEVKNPFEELQRVDWHTSNKGSLQHFLGDVPTLNWFLHYSDPMFEKRSTQERVRLCLKILRTPFQLYTSSLVRFLLDGSPITRELCEIKMLDDFSLIHLVAHYFPESFALFPRNYERRRINPLRADIDEKSDEKSKHNDIQLYQTILLLKDIILAAPLIHSLASWNFGGSLMTPLQHVLSGYLRGFQTLSMIRREEDKSYLITSHINNLCPTPLLIWLRLLKILGVDLVEYGREEQRIFREEILDLEFGTSFFNRRAGSRHLRFGTARLVSFSYGPEPENWKFFLVEVMGYSFVDFWEMVDHPERAMPGAWDDDDGYDVHDW